MKKSTFTPPVRWTDGWFLLNRNVRRCAGQLGVAPEVLVATLRDFAEVLDDARGLRVALRHKAWFTPPGKSKDGVRLDIGLLAAHVSDAVVVGVRRDERDTARWLTFDIDTKTPAKRRTRKARHAALVGALAGVPTVTTRSSGSGGLHVHVFLSGNGATTREVAAFAKAVSQTTGIPLEPGTLEFFPSSNALRLPLGRGGALLNDRTLDELPLTRFRQVRRFITLARRNAVSKERLFATIPTFTPPGREGLRRRKPHQRLTLGSLATLKTLSNPFKEECRSALRAAIPKLGMRWALFKKLVWFLAVCERKSDAAIERRIKKWLVSENHVSKDLTADFDGTVSKMLAAIPKIAGGYRRKHEVLPGHGPSLSTIETKRRKAGLPAIQQYSSSTHTPKGVQLLALKRHGKWRRAWRKVAATFAKPGDVEAFAGAHPWLQRTMPVFAGLLRLMLRGGRFASMHSDDLLAIATGNRAPEELQPLLRGQRRQMAAYRVMLRYAKEAGWLRLRRRGEEGLHADIYEITIDCPRRRR
ncbi:MAG: hypothetical protein JNJ54_22960 [Myxococcaceae bacterium]|nr:hypothetical protein [Myxococcaceae bacterium]